MERAPRVYLCASAQDAKMAEMLRTRLRWRGLELYLGGELGESASIDVRQQTIENCDIELVILSVSSARSDVVTADYQYALSCKKTLIPLIADSLKRLPPELRDTQASDFSHSGAEGWASLLITLDTLGMARYPAPTIPELDGELAVARARAGQIPPGWIVTRTFAPGPRRLTSATQLGLLFALPILIGGYFFAGRDPLVLAFGALLLVPLFVRSFRPAGIRLRKDAAMVVLAPDGIAVQTKSAVVWASFHEVSNLTSEGAAPDATTLQLVVRSNVGSRTAPMLMSALLPGVLGWQGVAFYLAWAERYLGGKGATVQPLEALLPPTLFISYARKDAEIVDRLELALQSDGFAPWVDRSGLIGGQAWSAQVDEALTRCAAVIVVITRASMRSEAVRKEYTAALAAGKPVVGVIVQKTRRIPQVLRSRIIADARPALGIAMLDLALALDNAGIHAVSGYTLPGAYRLSQEPTLLLARALHGASPPNGRLYQGRFPFGLVYSAVVVLLTALFFLGLYLVGGPPLFLIISLMLLAVAAPAYIFTISRRLRYPDVVLTLPEGFIAFTDSAHIVRHTYASLRSLVVGKPDWSRGIPIRMEGAGGAPILQWLPPTLRQRRLIAARIAEDFAAFQASRSTF